MQTYINSRTGDEVKAGRIRSTANRPETYELNVILESGEPHMLLLQGREYSVVRVTDFDKHFTLKSARLPSNDGAPKIATLSQPAPEVSEALIAMLSQVAYCADGMFTAEGDNNMGDAADWKRQLQLATDKYYDHKFSEESKP